MKVAFQYILLLVSEVHYNGVYCLGGERNVKYIIATHSNTLMVYSNVTLEWTAQVPHPPVAVSTGKFEWVAGVCVELLLVYCIVDYRGLKGVIVTLDELGHVICSYMGTDPSHFTPPTPQAREMDYEVNIWSVW